MNIFNIFEENSVVSKSRLLKTTDLLLTPCFKAFGGREISILVAETPSETLAPGEVSGLPFYSSYPPKSLSTFKRTLWTVAAIVTAPLAIIAALLKSFAPPLVEVEIGKNVLAPSLSELSDHFDALRKAKGMGALKGKITVYLNMDAGVSGVEETISREAENLGLYNTKFSVVSCSSLPLSLPCESAHSIVKLEIPLQGLSKELHQKPLV